MPKLSPPARTLASAMGGNRPPADRDLLYRAFVAQKTLDALTAFRDLDPSTLADEIVNLQVGLQTVAREAARATFKNEALIAEFEARLAENFTAPLRDAS